MCSLVVGSLGYRLVADTKSRESSSTPRGPQVPRRFCLSSDSGGRPRHGGGVSPRRYASKKEVSRHGSGKREVVQRCEGVWLYLPGKRRGRVRALQCRPGPGLQEPGRG